MASSANKVIKELFFDILGSQEDTKGNTHDVDTALVKDLYDVYMNLYTRARTAIKEHNPCNIHMKMVHDKLRPVCNATRDPIQGFGMGDGKALCCSGCKNLSDKGCTVKALTCSTWFCPAVKSIPGLGDEVNDILKTMEQYHFWVYRGSEVDSILQSYLMKKRLSPRDINTMEVRKKIEKLIQSFSIKTEVRLNIKKLINGKVYQY